jgi:hypothetical protein
MLIFSQFDRGKYHLLTRSLMSMFIPRAEVFYSQADR